MDLQKMHVVFRKAAVNGIGHVSNASSWLHYLLKRTHVGSFDVNLSTQFERA